MSVCKIVRSSGHGNFFVFFNHVLNFNFENLIAGHLTIFIKSSHLLHDLYLTFPPGNSVCPPY